MATATSQRADRALGGAGPVRTYLTVRASLAAFVLFARPQSWTARCYDGLVSFRRHSRLLVLQRRHVKSSLFTPVAPDAVDQGPHLPAPAHPLLVGDFLFEFMPVRRRIERLDVDNGRLCVFPDHIQVILGCRGYRGPVKLPDVRFASVESVIVKNGPGRGFDEGRAGNFAFMLQRQPLAVDLLGFF